MMTARASLKRVRLCGAAMLVCYVLFAGGVGGGDLKLIAMMGAWLGVYRGLEAMLWTMVIAGGMEGRWLWRPEEVDPEIA